MGQITRHTGAPYEDGEVLTAGTASAPAGLEIDVSRFYAEFNGGIDNSNVASGADISGSKIASATLAAGDFADASVTLAKLADKSILNAKVTDANITTAKIEESVYATAEATVDDVEDTVTDADWTTLAEGTVETGQGNTSRVVAIISCAARSQTASLITGQLRFRRNNVVLYTTTLGELHYPNDSSRERHTWIWLDSSAPGSSVVTYDLQALFTTASTDLLFGEYRFGLLNLRA